MNIEEVAEFLSQTLKNVTTLDDEYVSNYKVKDVSINQAGTIVIRHEGGRIDLNSN